MTLRWRMVFIVISFLSLGLFVKSSVFADEFEDIAREINQLSQSKEQSEAATKPLESELFALKTRLAHIYQSIDFAEENISKLEKNIGKREKDFDKQYGLLSVRAEQVYKHQYSPNDFALFFEARTFSDFYIGLKYRQSIFDKDKQTITDISKELLQLQSDREKVRKDKLTLERLRANLAEKSSFFEGEIKGAKDYQKTLETKITQLTQKQQDLVAKKTATFQTSVGDVSVADDPASRPDYNPGFSPAFAAFSFGAPHFKGMSQYGAFGRAKAGQNYEAILKTYYGNVRIEEVDTNFDLPTTAGNLSFENNYLKGIAEMPTSWANDGGFEALKAQAIAARSYALAYTDWRMGSRSTKKSICTTENCQVYNSSKASNPGRWGDAVNETKGKILVSNQSNEVINAFYSSTTGGYQESYSALGHSTPAFWDTANGRSGWTSQAYEKLAGSPWFYKGWYKTRGGVNCSRSHPWLNQDEFSDIINALIVYTNNKDMQGHLSQEDSGCFGDKIPDTWSKDQMRQEAAKYGGAVTSISGVDVVYSEAGVTAQVKVSTNRGSLTFNGNDFMKIFNLRVPGAIHLKSGLFNIEKK